MKARFVVILLFVFAPTAVLMWAVAAQGHASPVVATPNPVDVVLALDTSESMAYDAPSGFAYTGNAAKGCKPADVGFDHVNACIAACNADPDHPCYPLRQVKNAAKSFVDQLHYGADRVAIVSYDRQAPDPAPYPMGLDLAAAKLAIDGIRAHDHFGADPPGTECPYFGTPGMRWTCGTSDPGSALLRAAHEISSTSTITDTRRFVLLISGGGINSTDPDPASSDPLVQQYGYCPPKNPIDPLTRDDPPPCRDQRFSAHHPITDTWYDAEDFAVDAALKLGIPITPDLRSTIFAIGLGMKVVCTTGAIYDPGPPVVCGNWNPFYEDQDSHLPNTGELFLRYVAAVGDDSDPDTDPCMGVFSGVQCGNYYFAPTGASVFSITLDIADRIFTATLPTAAFSATPQSGIAPLAVDFVDASVGDIASRLWDFGDTFTSTQPSPTHTYTTPGPFTVTLRVNNPTGYDILTRTNYITVYASVSADFSANPISGVRPLTVTFTNQSLGDFDRAVWNFGDGITGTLLNPTHTYQSNGTYTVTLQVSGPGGTSSRMRDGYITVLAPEWKFYLPLMIK